MENPRKKADKQPGKADTEERPTRGGKRQYEKSKQNVEPKDQTKKDDKPDHQQKEKRPRTRQNPQEGGQKEQKPRLRFVYPENWKEKALEGLTLETKIPENPKGAELITKPNLDAHHLELEKIQKKIEQLNADFEKLKVERKDYLDNLKNANKGLKDELKELKKQKDEKYMTEFNTLKQQSVKLGEDIDRIRNKKDQIKQKNSTKTLEKGKILKQIEEKKQELNERQLSAHEEDKIVTAIEKLEDLLEQIKPIAKLQKDEEELIAKRKVVNEKMSALKNEMAPLTQKIDALYKKMSAKPEEKEKPQQPAPEENKNGEHQKPPKTEKDLEFDERFDKIRQARKELYKKKDELHAQFDQLKFKFEEQQFKIRELDHQRNHQSYLKRQEQRKKEDQERKEKQAEQKQKEKELLKTKYQKEID